MCSNLGMGCSGIFSRSNLSNTPMRYGNHLGHWQDYEIYPEITSEDHEDEQTCTNSINMKFMPLDCCTFIWIKKDLIWCLLEFVD